MASPGERIDLPNGHSVYYVDEDHSYWRCNANGSRGKRLTGVTTAVAPLDFRPDRLLSWAARTQCIGIADLYMAAVSDQIQVDLSWLSSQDSIWAELESRQLTFEHVRDRAAKRGTVVHELAFRALAMGRPVPDLEGMTDEERGYAKAVMEFWLDHDPEPLQVEQVIHSETLGVAGRLDFRGTIKSREGIGVLDLKTSGFIPNKAHAQVAGYQYLAEESGFGPSEWGALLRVSEDGSYELVECQAGPEDFLAAVDIYRRSARIGREAGKARKAVAA